jgi:hypothetical protein
MALRKQREKDTMLLAGPFYPLSSNAPGRRKKAGSGELAAHGPVAMLGHDYSLPAFSASPAHFQQFRGCIRKSGRLSCC